VLVVVDAERGAAPGDEDPMRLATAVTAYFVDRGIAAERLTTVVPPEPCAPFHADPGDTAPTPCVEVYVD
jgi:hypothetical protein